MKAGLDGSGWEKRNEDSKVRKGKESKKRRWKSNWRVKNGRWKLKGIFSTSNLSSF